jgi:hypothetical protein
VENIARSIAHVTPSHLADHALFDFRNLALSAVGLDGLAEWRDETIDLVRLD